MATSPASPPVARRRPTPVTILAAIQAIGAVGYLATFAALAGAELDLLAGLAARRLVVVPYDALAGIGVAVIVLVLGVFGIAAAILMFRMQRLGWTITMLLTGWSLAMQIYLYVAQGELSPPMMLFNVVIVLYLNQRQVRAAFGIGVPTAAFVPELDERA